MRIAMILSVFPALSETFILSQITGLVDQGCEVDIYALRRPDDKTTQPDVARYALQERTHYPPPMPQNRFLRILNGVALLAMVGITRPHLLLRILKTIRRTPSPPSPGMLCLLAREFSRRNYDIVHCHFGPLGSLGVFLRMAGLTDARLVTSFYGYDISRHVHTHDHQPYELLFQSGDAFLALSRHMKQKLIDSGCPARKVQVHHLGIDCRTFRYAPRRLADGERIRILTIARLVEKKGIQYGIEAISQLVAQGFDLDYEIIGDGPLREELEALIAELDMANRITLPGWKAQEEVLAALYNAHILLTPSVTAADGDQEGTPTVLLEAMATGMPVISTLHSGIPEQIEDGVSGFLVPERDASALAEKLASLIQNPETWLDMGEAGRRQVENEFDQPRLTEQLIETYRRLAQSD